MAKRIINEKKLIICLVIPSLQAGGMERVMSELAGYFATRKDIEQHLILYGISREIFYPVPENLIIHKPSFRFNNRWRVFYTLRTLSYLRSTIKTINPKSILSFGEYWNSFVLMALFGLKYPVYISDRCSPEKKFNAFHTYLRRVLYPRAEGIIGQTEKAKEIYLTQFKHNNIRVIGNPIRKINSGEEEKRQNVVLMVSRLIKSKNQDKLIEMFLDLQVPAWRLILVGYDHLQQNNYEPLMNLIKKHQAEHNVLLEGKQADVESYYNTSKIFAFTSSSEGFPNVIGEAMSAGLPVVAFDCVAGPSEMIKNGHNGYLIPLFDYNQFKEKLKILMMNDELRASLGNNGREDIKQFSVNNIGDMYLQFILGN